MKVIMKRELKNYFKNPIYYVGILLIFFEVFQDHAALSAAALLGK